MQKSPLRWVRQEDESVTYIAALRSPEGVVLSADSQETVGDEKVYVEKIETRKTDFWQIAIAGAGRGELVDGFIQSVKRIIQRNPRNGKSLEKSLEVALLKFYRRDVKLLRGKQKTVGFLIAATQLSDPTIYLWRTSGARLLDVPQKAAIGYRAPFCSYILQRLYRPTLPLEQLVLLSAYLVTIAKESGVSVGGNTQIAVVRQDGIWIEPTDSVTLMEERLNEYERQINQVFLNCADTHMSVPDLEDSIDEFKKTALELHREHIDRQAQQSFGAECSRAQQHCAQRAGCHAIAHIYHTEANSSDRRKFHGVDE